MKKRLYSNELKAKEFNFLRESVGWGSVPEAQIELALQNGLYSIVVKDGKCVIGMGRLVGDGVMYWYIQDLIVKPEYQNQGIGRAIIENLIDHVYENSIPNTNVVLGLMAAKGKEEFYKRFGFIYRPNEAFGAGMIKNISIPDNYK